jgi:chitin disaccharide deacetylase
MNQLIINADDFGLTDGVCRGIVQAIDQGLVSSCTAMVCMPGATERIARWAPRIAGKIGLHLQLTGDCRPCLPPEQIPSLLAPNGLFPRRPEDVVADPLEAAREWRAQVVRLRDLGVEPNHLDSHHHIHQRPELLPVYVDLASELGLPVRNLKKPLAKILDLRGVKHPATCITDWFGENTDLENIIACLKTAYEKVGTNQLVELMCHPGYEDQELQNISSYTGPREAELGVLTSPETARVLAEMGVQVVDWEVLVQ